MLRRERGQVAAEYVGMLLLGAVIVAALVTAGPAQRIADGAARAVCRIAGGDCAAAPGATADHQAVERAAGDLRGLLASYPHPNAVAAFFKGLDPAAPTRWPISTRSSSATPTARRSRCATPPTPRR